MAEKMGGEIQSGEAGSEAKRTGDQLSRSDSEPDGQVAEPIVAQGVNAVAASRGCAGVADSVPRRLVSVRARGGQVGNDNARKTGEFTVRRERKQLVSRAYNGRSAEGRYVADQRENLIGDLGGYDHVSTQQAWLADEAAFLRLELAYIRTWLATQSPINKRKRAAHPILRDYTALVKSLTAVLGQLGLERKAGEVPDLTEYLAGKETA